MKKKDGESKSKRENLEIVAVVLNLFCSFALASAAAKAAAFTAVRIRFCILF